MEKTPMELRAEAARIEREQHEKERIMKRQKKQDFIKKTGIDVYTSDDYCGLEAKGISFYYGYEVTACPVNSHKDEDDCYEKDCDKREWCFVATENGVEVMKLTKSELHPEEGEEPFWYLIAGIGHYLNKH